MYTIRNSKSRQIVLQCDSLEEARESKLLSDGSHFIQFSDIAIERMKRNVGYANIIETYKNDDNLIAVEYNDEDGNVDYYTIHADLACYCDLEASIELERGDRNFSLTIMNHDAAYNLG